MKILNVLSFCLLCIMLSSTSAFAQPVNTNDETLTEASDPATEEVDDIETPRDSPWDIHLVKERHMLEYDHIREADIFWSKRIWRVIDVREKMNLPFVYPKEPFINIMLDAALEEEVTVYSTIDDEFTTPLNVDEVGSMGTSVDTIITFDPETYEEKIQVVRNDLNWEDIKRFRVKEDWFFDEETSTMQVRILGIAPLKEVFDDNGNFKFELPMFWAYYPELRTILARHEAFNPLNDAVRMSWEDIFEMRLFSSYIFKESNVYDRRVQDYKVGIDILHESEAIRLEIFNYEHDLWTF